MTVGILGMAFKAEQRRHPLEPLVQAAPDPAVQGQATCSAPIPTSRSIPTCVPLDEVLARGRPPRRRRAARGVPRPATRRSPSSTSGTCSGEGVRCDARASRSSSRPTTRATTSSPCLDRILEAVTLPCEILVVVDDARRLDGPGRRASRRDASRGCAPCVNTYGRGPANAIRYGIDHAAAPVAVVTMADGCDDPFQIDELDPPRRAGRRGRRGEPLRPHRPAGRRPVAEGRRCRGSPA